MCLFKIQQHSAKAKHTNQANGEFRLHKATPPSERREKGGATTTQAASSPPELPGTLPPCTASAAIGVKHSQGPGNKHDPVHCSRHRGDRNERVSGTASRGRKNKRKRQKKRWSQLEFLHTHQKKKKMKYFILALLKSIFLFTRFKKISAQPTAAYTCNLQLHQLKYRVLSNPWHLACKTGLPCSSLEMFYSSPWSCCCCGQQLQLFFEKNIQK